MPLEYQLNEDDNWIREHFHELVERYEGKYVAVVDREVVAVDNSALEVERIGLKKNPNKLPSVILIPQKEDFQCLL